MQNSNCKLILGIVITFTLIQLTILFIFGYTPYPDSNAYIQLAQECVRANESYPIATENTPFIWNIGAINAIYYSLKLFGSITPLFIIYSLLKGCSAWFIFQISKKIFNYKTALIALILYVIYPANYGESTSALSELPFVFFMLAGITLTLHNKSISGGMLLAIGNWFRPMGIVFILSLVIYLIFINKKKIITLITGYVTVIMLIGGITFYRTGYFIYQAKTGWMSLLEYSLDNSNDKKAKEIHQNVYNIINNNKISATDKDEQLRSICLKWIRDHKTEYISQMPKKLINTYISDNVNLCVFIKDKNKKEYMYESLSMKTIKNSFPILNRIQWLAIINIIYYYLILICSCIGIYIIIRKKQIHQLIIPGSIITLGTLILLVAGHGEARFHIPLMPFFIILSAYIIEYMYNKKIE